MRLTRKNLNKGKSLIAFIGAPWTLLVYMINKKSPKNKISKFFFDNKNLINEILNFNTFQFIGLIGSKTKRKRFSNRLVKLGHNQYLINKIECPIGLKNIASKKPGEIAISIIARLLEYRSNLSLSLIHI